MWMNDQVRKPAQGSAVVLPQLSPNSRDERMQENFPGTFSAPAQIAEAFAHISAQLDFKDFILGHSCP
jgi:hypothetical protein